MSLDILRQAIINTMVSTPLNNKPVDEEAARLLIAEMSLQLGDPGEVSEYDIGDEVANIEMEIMDLFFEDQESEEDYTNNLKMLLGYFDEVINKVMQK